MEDARFVSNYLPSGMFEKKIQQDSNIQTNEEYRHYLTNNATNMIERNKASAMSQNVDQQFLMVPNKNHGPYVFDDIHTMVRPQGYETNSTKVRYLSRQQIQANKFNKRMNM